MTRHMRTGLPTTISPALPALPVVMLILSFALPPETSVSLGSVRLSPYRLILLAGFFPALHRVTAAWQGGLCAPDIAVIGHGVWAMVALVVTMGLADSAETAVIYLVETTGSYMIARAYVRTLDDYIAVIRLIFWTASLLLAFAVAESLSGHHFLRLSFKAILGGPGPHDIEPRLGLTRAFTSFEHPILFGVFAASAFAGTYYLLSSGDRRDMVRRLSIMAATFFSLSGGPYTMLALQLGLIAWDRITATLAHRWTLLVAVFAAAWLVLTLASNRSPVLVFVSYLTFSASSAYNRVHIWTYGTAEVARHPVFGIGLNDWIRAPWMSSSMDNFWLLTTVRYGLPALVCLVLALIWIGRKHAALRTSHPVLQRAQKAWAITMLGFVLAGLTVHFWNALLVQLFFMIGCGMCLTLRPAQKVAPARAHGYSPQPASFPVSSPTLQKESLSWT